MLCIGEEGDKMLVCVYNCLSFKLRHNTLDLSIKDKFCVATTNTIPPLNEDNCKIIAKLIGPMCALNRGSLYFTVHTTKYCRYLGDSSGCKTSNVSLALAIHRLVVSN